MNLIDITEEDLAFMADSKNVPRRRETINGKLGKRWAPFFKLFNDHPEHRHKRPLGMGCSPCYRKVYNFISRKKAKSPEENKRVLNILTGKKHD